MLSNSSHAFCLCIVSRKKLPTKGCGKIPYYFQFTPIELIPRALPQCLVLPKERVFIAKYNFIIIDGKYEKMYVTWVFNILQEFIYEVGGLNNTFFFIFLLEVKQMKYIFHFPKTHKIFEGSACNRLSLNYMIWKVRCLENQDLSNIDQRFS